MATIKEISKKCEVSPATVSRVLNQDQTLSINTEKRKLILEVAEELNYKVPKQRNNNKKNYELAFIQWKEIEEELNDPYYLSIRMGIEKYCDEKNIVIDRIYKVNDQFEFKKKYHGIVAIGKYSTEEIENFKLYTTNIVFVDSSPLPNEYDSVVIDYTIGIKNVIDYLKTLNHKKIGYIGGIEYVGDNQTPLGERRETEFRKLVPNSNDIYVGEFSIKSGEQLMRKAIEKPELPTAFFVASDTMAIGVLKALYDAGIRVPDDISICGFNDIPTAQYTNPALTTVKVYTKEMAEIAMELMIENLSEPKEYNKKIVLPVKLIVRDSVK